ncbi:MAG: hypothetical protein ACJAZS_000406 [Alteromonas naphthalenivorans]|jgi:hypothetical protein
MRIKKLLLLGLLGLSITHIDAVLAKNSPTQKSCEYKNKKNRDYTNCIINKKFLPVMKEMHAYKDVCKIINLNNANYSGAQILPNAFSCQGYQLSLKSKGTHYSILNSQCVSLKKANFHKAMLSKNSFLVNGGTINAQGAKFKETTIEASTFNAGGVFQNASTTLAKRSINLKKAVFTNAKIQSGAFFPNGGTIDLTGAIDLGKNLNAKSNIFNMTQGGSIITPEGNLIRK